MKNKNVLLFDDDTEFVKAISDELHFELRKFDFSLVLAQDIAELKAKLPNLGEIYVCILDLWIIDKQNNKQNTDAGESALRMIRNKWPNVYVIMLSSHLDEPTIERLQDTYDQILVANKPVPTSKLIELVRVILKQMDVL